MTKISALKNQAEYLLTKLEHGRCYKIGDLTQRLNKAADENPRDIVIISVARVIENIEKKNPDGIISQGQLEEIYQELIGLNTNTRFREVLGDLLHTRQAEPNLTNEKFINSIRNPDEEKLEYVNKKYADKLSGLFEETNTSYNSKNASRAKEKVEAELRSLGFKNPKVYLEGGNNSFLVFSTSIDTNRGTVPVYIPTEASGDKFPEVFVGANDLEKLTASNLSKYVKTATDKHQLKVVLNQNSIDLPKPSVPEVLKPLASSIEDIAIEASVGFPQSSVTMAKQMISAELGAMGFRGSQIKVISPTNDGFICQAILNTPNGKMDIEVPVEMNGETPLLPSVFAKNDYIADFNAANLQSLILKHSYNNNYTSIGEGELYSLSFNDLRDAMIKSASVGDFNTCDEVLEVISKRFNEDAYRNIVADYHRILTKMGNKEEAIHKASEDKDNFVMTPNSIYPIHKKLGLPAHQLIRDENGKWHRKSSYAKAEKGIDVTFSTGKFLIGE